MKIGYIVHDLADDAVHRRVRMLQSFGDVTVLGFRRSDNPVPDIAGLVPIDLGRTIDARFGQRVAAVLHAAATMRRWQEHLRHANILIARQLEVLCLAAVLRNRVAPEAPLVFECLDIHRLMLDEHLVGIALRSLERRLLSSCALLMVSSPAFLANHFARYGAAVPQALLLENKVQADDVPADVVARLPRLRAGGPPPGPPWRIGWFGVIRCRRSLQLLTELATRLPNQIEVVIRGRPKRNVIPDFDALVAATPGCRFLGEYDRHTDLPAIYSDVHFAWAIDFYEAGRNSDWLLPNRLYEGALYGAVPLALAAVETGRWLTAHRCGVCLPDGADRPLADSLWEHFRRLDADAYAGMRHALAQVPVAALLDDAAAAARLGATLTALPRRSAP